MNRSENIADLATALSKAQADLKPAVKDAKNPFYKSSYADLPSVVAACKEVLSQNGLSYSQVPDFQDDKVWIETVLMHSSGQWISGRYPINPTKNDPQSMGSALTYSRRYALMAMVGVVASDDDDDGNAASTRPAAPERPSAPAPKVSSGDVPGTVSTASGAPKPSDEKREKAVAWGKEEIAKCDAFKDLKAFDAWRTPEFNAALKRLEHIDAKTYDNLCDAIDRCLSRLNPIGS